MSSVRLFHSVSFYHCQGRTQLSNNIWTLGYDCNRTYSTVLNMSPYVENPRRERFHHILVSSKFLHYRATLHDAEHNKTAKGNHPKMVNISFLSKGIVSTVLLLILILKRNLYQLLWKNESIYMNLHFVLLQYQTNPTSSIHSINAPQIFCPSVLTTH